MAVRASAATIGILVVHPPRDFPNHNGEVFLSKIAVNQNPGFFGFPFTGAPTPKFAYNPSYPQRELDPVVNITVYDPAGNVALTKTGFELNTVYYSTKSEIRITLSSG